MMTAEKAIGHFERYVNDDCYTIEHREACRMAISVLREQEQQRWIPVTERLPENIGLYLVIVKHWIDGSPVRKIAKWNTVDWFTADRKSKEITPRVTHWMPMPEPPNEVSR